MGMSAGSHVRGRKRNQPERDLFPSNRLHTVLTTGQTTLQDETEAQTVKGQWWAGPQLDLGLLRYAYPCPLLKLCSNSRTIKMT